MESATADEPIVRLADVRKEYSLGGMVTALDGVDLSLPAGSYTAVMGPSGSGKSTLLNLIGALDTPTAGRVSVDGTDIAGLSESGRAKLRGTKIGFVFQTFNLMPRLSARENVELPLVFAEWDTDRRTERAEFARFKLDKVPRSEAGAAPPTLVVALPADDLLFEPDERATTSRPDPPLFAVDDAAEFRGVEDRSGQRGGRSDRLDPVDSLRKRQRLVFEVCEEVDAEFHPFLPVEVGE